MRKSPLKRKTQLKRSSKTLRKKRINPVSADKGKWLKLYREMRAKDPTQLEAHHPFARKKEALLAYVLVSREKHREIHDNGKEAYAQGWLQGPYYGWPIDPNHPRPWSVHEEFRWSEKYKRTRKETE